MKNNLTFAAIGNSLTVGYQSPLKGYDWSKPTPYTSYLMDMSKQLLDDMGNNELIVEFHNLGIVGELTEDMLYRFKRDVIDIHPNYVIILGGSNDIGMGISPQNITANLVEMYETALEQGVTPISCTIPSILGFDIGIPPRLQLNQIIKNICLEKEVVCVDLFTATSDPETNRLRNVFSNDGLHLNTEGYKTLAVTIFSQTVKAIVTSYYKNVLK